MHILLAILHTDPARGGAERYTIDLAKGLSQRGEEVTLAALTLTPAVIPTGVKPLQLGRPSSTRLGQYLSYIDALNAHLAAARPPYDVVHAMLPVRKCDLYHPHAGLAMEAVKSGHEKYGSGLHAILARLGNLFNRKRRRFAQVEWELLTNSHPPVVLCLSNLIKQAVRRHYPLDDKHLVRLFNAVDLVKFDPQSRAADGLALRQRLGINQDRVVGLIIAQDFQRKGLREAIAAAAKVSDPHLVLVVVGKEDPAAYRRQASSLNISDRIIFAGKTDDPAAFYAASDFFVLPTRHDPCSLVVLEALAMGRPVISTKLNGACEIMTPGEHGFVLQNPADVSALTQAMTTMLDDSKRLVMRDCCLALRPKLSQEAHLDQLMGLYRAAITPRAQH